MKPVLRAEAEHYWWFRLVKTTYTLFVILVAIIGIGVLYDSRPEISYYSSSYSVACDNGYTFGKFPSKGINYDYGLKLDEQKFSFVDSDLHYVSKEICYRGTRGTDEDLTEILTDIHSHGEIWLANVDRENNYSIYIPEKIYSPTTKDYLIQIALCLLALAAMIKGVPMLFNYVVFGKKRIAVALEE